MRLSQSPLRIRARRTVLPAVLVLALAATPAATVAPDDGSTAYAVGGAAYGTDAFGRPQISNTGQAYLDAKLPIRHRVEDLLLRMTLEEKVGQMTQAERGAVTGDASLIKVWGLGSVLSGGGSVPTPNSPQGWADMVDRFQAEALKTRLQIPLLYGVDSVHGHGNLLGATVFPHNIGLGSTWDPDLVRRIAHVVAEETRATGPQWTFAPCVCVARDARWGRTYESFSEHPGLVTRYASSIEGFQGTRSGELRDNDRVLASTKHYAGDGDTRFGSAAGDYTIDQGVTVTNRRDFVRIDLAPYVDAVGRYDTGTVMPSFSSVDWTEDGEGNPIKMHANRELITDVLKGKLDFDGFVISDWEGIHQLPGDWATQVRTGVNAGIDMFMEPNSYQSFEITLLDEVRAGRVAQPRIDDAVRRILTKKFELGLFEKPYTDRTHLGDVGSAAHRALAREAVAKSQVLLKNSGGVLPLKKNAKVYVAGRNADDMGNQAGGWTLSWQGATGQDRIPGNSILEGIQQAGAQVTYSKDGSAPTAGSDAAVVVVGETPYAEGFGDVGGPEWPWDPEDGGVPREEKSLELQPVDKAVVDKVCGAVAKCVVLVVSGRPQVIAPAQLAKIDALVASWLPGSQGEGVADVLFGKRPFTGKLSHSWPRSADQEPINVGDRNYNPLYPFGWGLRTK
ncbi:beta-glucosidase [Kribbella sp. VKM Ac-2527]|uniref:beta-glucosidase n=1 Tax=Kribbella caucasensis TaxID=2512215 RepID=A0A4R6JFP1_9ACTN|nr:glycoside hydrolase family 3 protein [Kribbella sp. VKM Ac-2527]TDO34297.1 beta-glucosidase [Kribbella sp. VKM Ac-2527]